MSLSAGAEYRPNGTQLSESPAQTLPQRNAWKHGLRSAAVLLPDDDAEEFRRLRRDLFLTYRPRTQDEAACVESMASLHWRIARCRRWQTVYDAQTDALLTGDPNHLAGHICETDSHRWIHKAMDCTLQEGRLDRLLCRARDKLLLLQKLRRNHLIAGAVERAPICWGAEDPVGHPFGGLRTGSGPTHQADSPPQGGGLGGNGGPTHQADSPPQGGGLGGNGGPTHQADSPPQGLSSSAAKDGGLGGNGGEMGTVVSDSSEGEIEKHSERAEGTREPTPALRATSPCKQGEGFQADTLAGAGETATRGEKNERETPWK